MRPSEVLEKNREAIREATKRFNAANPRVFGSVARGEDRPDSDIDILVDALPGTTLFDLGGLQDALETLLKVRVDLVTAGGIRQSMRDRVLSEAAPHMNADRLREYLDQMRSAAVRAGDFVADRSKAEFMADIRTQMAVGMALVLIGEAASRIMAHHPDFPVDHPEIPWSKIRGLRNFVVHDYYELELPIVWDTVKTSLPGLVAELDSLRNWRAQGE